MKEAPGSVHGMAYARHGGAVLSCREGQEFKVILSNTVNSKLIWVTPNLI